MSTDTPSVELNDEEADDLLDRLVARAEERDDVNLGRLEKSAISRRTLLAGMAGGAGIAALTGNASAAPSWSNATGKAGTSADPLSAGYIQNLTSQTVDTDEVSSSDPYWVIDYTGTEYRRRSFASLDAALTEQNNLTHPATVYIPPGSHTFSTQISLGEGEGIVTDGYTVTELNYEGTTSPAVVRETGANFIHVEGGFELDLTNAGAGVVGAEIGGQRCYYAPIRVSNAPGDGIHVFGAQGSGTYYSVFEALWAEVCGGKGVVVRSPSGDARRVQANQFGMVTALNNTGVGIHFENEQNLNEFDMLVSESNGTPYIDHDGGETIVQAVYTSDGGANLALDTAGAVGDMVVQYAHIEGGHPGNIDWSNLTIYHGGKDTVNSVLNLDHTAKTVHLGAMRSGWSQRIQTHNGNIEFWDNQNSRNMARIVQGSGDIESRVAGDGLIVTTPDGTSRYRIRVDNTGSVVTDAL